MRPDPSVPTRKAERRQRLTPQQCVSPARAGNRFNEIVMALDILHLYATHDRTTQRFCRVEAFADQMKPLEPYFQPFKNQHIDWKKMFAAHGLVYADHRVLGRTTDGGYTSVSFVDADTEGADAPVRAIFSNEPRARFRFLQRTRFILLGDKDTVRAFGPFATVMKTDMVVFFEQVGYQRDGVSDAFFQQFQPDDLTCARDRVAWIHDAVLPEAREGFKTQFLDNWDERRSFVLISY
jgi:hypothetical protein